MFIASEAFKTFPTAEFLLAIFQAVALVGTTIWIKVILYRRRKREDEAECLPHEREQTRGHPHCGNLDLVRTDPLSRPVGRKSLPPSVRARRGMPGNTATPADGLRSRPRALPGRIPRGIDRAATKRLETQHSSTRKLPPNQHTRLL